MTKFPISDNGTEIKCAGGKWRYTNSAERQRAVQLADDHGLQRELVIQGRLGRPITNREAIRGTIQHKEDQDVLSQMDSQRRYDAAFAPVVKPSENPYRDKLAAREEELKRAKEIRKDPEGAILRSKAEEFDRQREAKEAKDKLDNDPLIQFAIQDAEARHAALSFDDHAPMSEIRDSEFRLRLAKAGRVDDYTQSVAIHQTRYAAHIRQRSLPTLEAAQRVLRDCEELAKPFKLPTPDISDWERLKQQDALRQQASNVENPPVTKVEST